MYENRKHVTFFEIFFLTRRQNLLLDRGGGNFNGAFPPLPPIVRNFQTTRHPSHDQGRIQEFLKERVGTSDARQAPFFFLATP